MISGLPFHWHVGAMVALVVLYLIYRGFELTRRRHWEVIGALLAAASVLLWPMGDLATHVSLSAAVVQRLVLMLVLVPVLILATPVSVIERITRPAIVDSVTRRLAHPGLSIIVVTIVGTVTVVPSTVDWASSAWTGHLVVLALTLFAGVVLWIPGLGALPGSRRLSPAGRAGFLFASSLAVTVLSFVWIFSTKPLYPGLSGQQEILGVSALFDQQLAGFIAKLGAYVPMWTVAFHIFFHSEDAGVPVEESPLHWADVERHLLRVDRQRRRANRRGGRTND